MFFDRIGSALVVFCLVQGDAVWAQPLEVGALTPEAITRETITPEAQAAERQAQALKLQAQKEGLGTILFHDPVLSNPPGQSCASCHKDGFAFADPGNVVSVGANKGVFGRRNTPSLTYAKFSPEFGKEKWGKDWRGGQFWDGRANSLKEQVLGPLTSPVEMNNSVEGLAKALRASGYWPQLVAIYGDATQSDQGLAEAAADALDAYQRTDVFAPFDSKWDYYDAGLLELTAEESLGASIYSSKGMCLDCHAGSAGPLQIYTQFKYHNILVPKNQALPFYRQPAAVNPDGANFIDIGLGFNERVPEASRKETRGLFKTPTLRNVAITAPYMHNGVFATLDEVVDFYVDIASFGPPEVNENTSRMLSMKVILTEEEKTALIAFLHTLTDGYAATPEQKAALKAQRAARLRK